MKEKIIINKSILVDIWNETEEINCNFEQLTNDELIQCKKTIKNRVEKVLNDLNPYIDEKDLNIN